MSDRVYASLFYIALIVGSSWVAVSVGEALTRQALTRLSLVEPSDPRPSRVDNYLAARERSSQPVDKQEPLIPAANAAPIGPLAKAMDDAETAVAEPDAEASEDTASTIDSAVTPVAPKPRVAGWSKRISKRDVSSALQDESSSHLIMRSLRAEM